MRLLLHHELDELVVYISLAGAALFGLEARTVDASVTVLVGLPDHLINLVVGELLTDGGHDVSELGGGDESVVVAIKDLEGLCLCVSL